MKKLLVVVPDKDIEYSVSSIIARLKNNSSIAIGLEEVEFCQCPGKDSGCRTKSVDYLRQTKAYTRTEKVLLVFDLHGSGHNGDRVSLEADLMRQFSINGWTNRFEVIVIERELEDWMWCDIESLEAFLDWQTKIGQPMSEWLKKRNLVDEHGMPKDAEEVFTQVCRASRTQLSASLYAKFAGMARISKCTSASFQKLRTFLQGLS